jgi:NADH-quinone oxidoreductase subunit N
MNINLTPFIPELLLTGGILILVIVDLLVKERRGIITAFGSVILLLAVAVVALSAEQNIGAYLFGSVVQDGPAVFFRVLFALATILSIALMTFSFPNESEPYFLVLSSVLGMLLLAGSNDIVTLFVALELVSIPSYVLAGYHRKDILSGEASLKYVLFGALSSGLMLYGFSLLYGLSGETNIPKMASALAATSGSGAALTVGLLLVIAGIGYKVALVPFHFWCPDVYQGSPTPITAFFSVTPKAAGFAALFRLMPVFGVLGGAATTSLTLGGYSVTSVGLLTILSAVTMTFGNLGAIWQENLKRLLAYSSIAHAGYILMGFVAMAAYPTGEIHQLAVMAVFFYLVVYVFMNLGAFFIVDLIERREGSDLISGIRGWGYTNVIPGLFLATFLFSLTGIPPLAGFVGKFYLLAALVQGKLFALAIIAVANTVVSLYYYVRIIRDMFLYDSEKTGAVSVFKTPGLAMVLGISTVAPTLILGVMFGGLAEWIRGMVM